MRDLIVKFYLRHLYDSRSDGRKILQMICDLLPELKPELYNSCEPVKKSFNDIESALDNWGSSFLWKRKNLSADGMVTFGSVHPRRPFHTSVRLEARLEILDTCKLAYFVQEFSKAFRTDIGLVHVFPRQVRGSRQPILNLSTFVLKEALPNLYWATIFGRPYIKLFGRERLLSTAASVVKELASDSIYIQLTEDIMDNRTRPGNVEIARQIAKKHLDSNAFFDAQLGAIHSYRTPEFHIEA